MHDQAAKIPEKLLIIDGFALIFRSYYAFARNPLRTQDGHETSAIFGFTKTLMKLLKEYAPKYWAIALDHPEKTFRHTLYPSYKANRIEAPEGLLTQIPEIIELINALQICSITRMGYEADDIIGSLCKKFKREEQLKILIMTSDKDILQLVDEKTTVISPARGITELTEHTPEKVAEKWGVLPRQIPDLLALMGDSSDNIAGVPGIGIKTASKLIQEHTSITGIYQNIHKISNKRLHEKLIQNKSIVMLNHQLASIAQELPITQQLNELEQKGLNHELAITLLQKYECHSILQDPLFRRESSPTTRRQSPNPRPTYHYIHTKEALDTFTSTIQSQDLITIDLETTSVNSMSAEILGVAISHQPHTGYFIPSFSGLKGIWPELSSSNLSQDETFKALKAICENSKIRKVGQNIKYDYIILKQHGIELKNIHFDTMLASHILKSIRRSHSMDYLAETLLKHRTIRYKDLVKNGQTLRDVPLTEVSTYAGEDADITLQLYQHFYPLIQESPSKSLYYQIEIPLITILGDMEQRGIFVDKKILEHMHQDYSKKLTEISEKIYTLAGKHFNINSPKQVQEILFETLQIKASKKTKSGYSTDSTVLEALTEEHALAKELLDYRKIHKIKTAYLEALPQMIHTKTQRIHSSFNQTFTQTGRLSSTKPNLQNIPSHDIRIAFLAEEGRQILSADYSQIELRILAHLSQDKKLIKAFQEQKDLHKETASLLFKKDIQEISPQERSTAKTINFAIIYGAGARSLSKSLKISHTESQSLITQYFQQYPAIQEYITQQKALAHRQGYVETLFKRRREIPELSSGNPRDKSFGERIAVNTPIQGSSADIIKKAMIKIESTIQAKKTLCKMLLQIHDELIFEVEESAIPASMHIIRDGMENIHPLTVPLEVSIRHGKTWADASK